MTVFVADKPVNLSLGEFDTIAHDLFQLSSDFTQGASDFEILPADGLYQLDLYSSKGDFVYGLGPNTPPTAGTVTSLTIQTRGSLGLSPAWSLTGMSVLVSRIEADVLNSPPNYKDVLKAIFPGHDHIFGSLQGGDYLASFARHDTITERGPNDSIVGGPGNETFVFSADLNPTLGNDVIYHFIASGLTHDTIVLDSLPLHNFHQVLTHSHIVHHELVITLDATDSITLANVHSKASLNSGDFHFVA
jgi:serralysin